MLLSKRKTMILIILTLIMTAGMLLVVNNHGLAIDDISQLQNELSRETGVDSQPKNVAVEFIKLLFILALIVGAAWSVVRLFGQKATARMQGTWLHVVDEVILGQNRGIVLCEVGERIYAVGVTDHNISLLFEINHPKLLEEIASGEYSSGAGADNARVFKDGINKLFKSGDSLANRKNFHYLMEEQNQRLQDAFNYDPGDANKKNRRSDDDV